jgi:Cu-Zn family superoxide dismutase
MVTLLAALLLVGCAQQGEGGGGEAAAEAVTPAEPAQTTPQAVAVLAGIGGSAVTGTATFTTQDGAVTLQLDLQNAPPGNHAVHLHEFGDCSAADGKSAGGHWNPTGVDHGEWGVDPFHLGDIGNFSVGEDGKGYVQLTTDLWSIHSGGDNDVVGRAVIVHAGQDDMTSQPSGAAGGRIGCGVIE